VIANTFTFRLLFFLAVLWQDNGTSNINSIIQNPLSRFS